MHIYYIVPILIFVVAMVLMITGYNECVFEGGKYVRGLFWFECIK